ncbi:glycosyltransferase [uncultured Tenacibaculum sp.]|uniref:glycosyltransferase family 2 protein n=1 Tax=uncultured Tenacibaculum sp. TaxID=174713 RepID=UPI002626FDF9|nr:glycosyltransferase [uncultured Tenacibaculum sp.]
MISVIIVTFHSEEVIFDCLDSLLKYNDIGRGLEIIVVDNSNDEVSNRMSDNFINLYGDKIIYKRSGGNVGFGTANNIGFNISSGEILLFLNPDTILIEPIFLKIIESFKNTKLGTLGLQMVDEHLNKQISFFFIRGYFTPLLNFLVKWFNRFDFKLGNMISSGACLFIKRNVFEDIGGFNTNMFLYHEESYIAKKILNLPEKYLLGFRSDLKYIHLEKKVQMSEFLLNEHHKSLSFYYKYFGFNFKIVKYLNLLLLSVKGLVFYITNNKKKLLQLNKEKESFNKLINKK